MTATPVAPPRPDRPKHRRAAGVTPCGAQPAQLYLCGWRCPDHAPGKQPP